MREVRICVHARRPGARPLSVSVLVVHVHAYHLCACLSSVCVLVACVRARCPVHGRSLMDISIYNDERRHRRHSSCGCHGLRGHWLASVDGREGVTHHKEQHRTMTSSSFIVWLPRCSQRRGTCTTPHPSPSVVMWRWSFAVVVVFGVWMVGDGR